MKLSSFRWGKVFVEVEVSLAFFIFFSTTVPQKYLFPTSSLSSRSKNNFLVCCDVNDTTTNPVAFLRTQKRRKFFLSIFFSEFSWSLEIVSIDVNRFSFKLISEFISKSLSENQMAWRLTNIDEHFSVFNLNDYKSYVDSYQLISFLNVKMTKEKLIHTTASKYCERLTMKSFIRFFVFLVFPSARQVSHFTINWTISMPNISTQAYARSLTLTMEKIIVENIIERQSMVRNAEKFYSHISIFLILIESTKF